MEDQQQSIVNSAESQVFSSDQAINATLTLCLTRRWPVFPLHTALPDGHCSCLRESCQTIGKHPRTLHGKDDASIDPEHIRKWWTRWPQANIGVVTGRKSGLFVIDIDPRHGGVESWKNLINQQRPLPLTVSVTSGGGGTHLFFICPSEGLPSSAGRLGKGIDTLGDGSSVILPPSTHLLGVYIWDKHPASYDLQLLPQWLLSLLQDSKKSTQALTLDWRQAGLKGVSEGERNDTMMRLAGRYIALGMPQEEVVALLQLVNKENHPPLAQDEIEKIVVSVSVLHEKKQHDAQIDAAIIASVVTGDPVSETVLAHTTEETVRTGKLKGLSLAFGIEIVRITRYKLDPPSYTIWLNVANGGDEKIHLGSVSNLIEQAQLRRHLAAASARLMKPISSERWWKIGQVLLDVVETIPAGDDNTDTGIVREWLQQYLTEHPVERDLTKIVIGQPFVKDGRIAIFGPPLRHWITVMQREYIPPKTFGRLLREFGAVPDQWGYVKNDGGHTTSSIWWITAHV